MAGAGDLFGGRGEARARPGTYRLESLFAAGFSSASHWVAPGWRAGEGLGEGRARCRGWNWPGSGEWVERGVRRGEDFSLGVTSDLAGCGPPPPPNHCWGPGFVDPLLEDWGRALGASLGVAGVPGTPKLAKEDGTSPA